MTRSSVSTLWAAALGALGLISLVVASGCSTLGIATEDDLLATQARLDSLGRVTGSLDRSVNQIQDNQNAKQAEMDSLSARFLAAKAWLESLDIEAISQNVDEIHNTAISAESRSQALSDSYLSWLRTQHEFLGKEIEAFEAQAQSAPGGTTPASDTTTDTEATPDQATDSAGDGD